MHMNNMLAEAQQQWNNQLLFPYVEQHQDHILSRPFYFGVADAYVESPKRIMIVGQETRDYGSYYDDWPMSDIRQWGVDYLRRQLWGIRCEDFKYNRSGFWKLFRCFAKAGYIPCWNNVDKIHQQKGNASTIRLTDEQKRAFCCTYGTDRKSLLRREIEIAEPHVVLFITGPNYHVSMTESFGLPDGALDAYRPTREHFCMEITEQANLGVPTFWAYHPSYLNRIHRIDDCVRLVIDRTL